MTLTLFYDDLSQPSRALLLFLRLNKIHFIPKEVRISEGMNRTEEFSKVNIFKKVPVIEHNGSYIMESIAILRYLCREYQVADHWYPKDSLKQARVDEYLEWHHLGTRHKVITYVWAKVLGPFVLGKNSDDKSIEKAKKELSSLCDKLNNFWLKDKLFLTSNEISIADLIAITEMEELTMSDFDPKIGRPVLANWMERVRNLTNPHYDNIHRNLNVFVETYLQKVPSKL